MNLVITAEERNELLQVVERTLGETRVEVRRTRTPDFHDQLQHEEVVLQSLYEKLKHLPVS